MQKHIFLVVLTFLLSFKLSAQIEVQSFRVLQTDLTARITDPVIDQNGEKCALIKVVTTQSGFGWEGGMLGIVKVRKKLGEYWVFLPHGAKKITIKHEQLGVLRNYIYPEAIREAMVYEMVLKDKKMPLKQGKGALNLESTPPDALIRIDGIPDFQKRTPHQFKDYISGPYRMMVSRPRYEPIDTNLTIYKDSLVKHSLKLRPRFGVLILDVSQDDAIVFIENEQVGTGSLSLEDEESSLDAGRYSIEVKKEKYHSFFEVIEIVAAQAKKTDHKPFAQVGDACPTNYSKRSRLLFGWTKNWTKPG
jgi:PEGA domain